MDFITKKTHQLTKDEKVMICDLFKSVFNKEKTLVQFNKQFETTCSGFSYHTFIIEKDVVVGCYSAIPFRFNYFGKETIFALSVDTMIDEHFRGHKRFENKAKRTYQELIKDRVSFVYGFPNDNVYMARKLKLDWIDIAQLKFYILPLRVSSIKPIFGGFDFVVRLVAAMMNVKSINLGNSANDSTQYAIEKVNDSAFRSHRYSYHDGHYNIAPVGHDTYYVYRIVNVGPIKTAYIVDVYPLNKSNLEYAVREIYKKEANNIDIIMYIGILPFSHPNLFELPKRFEPKTVYMSGKILDPQVIDNRIFNVNNWNVNLSNYDVV